jgi:hypothetical protein
MRSVTVEPLAFCPTRTIRAAVAAFTHRQATATEAAL